MHFDSFEKAYQMFWVGRTKWSNGPRLCLVSI